MKIFFYIVWILLSICAWYIYHSIFNVIYFSGKGCVTEIFFCGVVGMFLALFVFANPYLSIPLVIILLLISYKKSKK